MPVMDGLQKCSAPEIMYTPSVEALPTFISWCEPGKRWVDLLRPQSLPEEERGWAFSGEEMPTSL